MVKEFLHEIMVISLQVSIKMIKKMGMGFLNGVMVEFIKDAGKMEF